MGSLKCADALLIARPRFIEGDDDAKSAFETPRFRAFFSPTREGLHCGFVGPFAARGQSEHEPTVFSRFSAICKGPDQDHYSADAGDDADATELLHWFLTVLVKLPDRRRALPGIFRSNR